MLGQGGDFRSGGTTLSWLDALPALCARIPAFLCVLLISLFHRPTVTAT